VPEVQPDEWLTDRIMDAAQVLISRENNQ
jgi:Ulp1 family protease